jgi:cytochrome c oxidase subunit IV
MSEHIVSKKVYFVIFGALIVGTIATYLVALRSLDDVLFPGANTVVALAIAFTKASLVVLYFMHVRYSSRLIAVFVLSGIFWLGVMFLLTMTDFTSRQVVTYEQPKPAAVESREGGAKPAGSEVPAGATEPNK